MNREMSFTCGKCRKAVTIRDDDIKPYVPCPQCGAMNRTPSRKKAKSRRFGLIALAIVLFPIALVAIFWSLTMTMGADSLRPEITQLARGRKNVVVEIKAPAPFVLTYTISVSGRGEGQPTMTIRKYYYWFLTIKREVPEADVPEFIARVWR